MMYVYELFFNASRLLTSAWCILSVAHCLSLLVCSLSKLALRAPYGMPPAMPPSMPPGFNYNHGVPYPMQVPSSREYPASGGRGRSNRQSGSSGGKGSVVKCYTGTEHINIYSGLLSQSIKESVFTLLGYLLQNDKLSLDVKMAIRDVFEASFYSELHAQMSGNVFLPSIMMMCLHFVQFSFADSPLIPMLRSAQKTCKAVWSRLV